MRNWRLVLLATVLLVGLLCVVFNPRVWWALALAILIGLVLWYPKRVGIPLGITLATLGALYGALLFLVGPKEGSPSTGVLPNARSIDFDVQATYSSETSTWIIHERFILPGDVLNRLEGEHSYRETTPLSSGAAQRLVLEDLASGGWAQTGSIDGDLTFETAKPAEIEAVVRNYPVTTTLELPVPRIYLQDDTVLVPGKDSNLTLTAPDGMTLDTDPISEADSIPDGEQRIIPLNTNNFYVENVTVEAVSPLIRFEPLRTMARLSLGSATTWVIGVCGVMAFGLAKEQAKGSVSRLFRRHTPRAETEADIPLGQPTQHHGRHATAEQPQD